MIDTRHEKDDCTIWTKMIVLYELGI